MKGLYLSFYSDRIFGRVKNAIEDAERKHVATLRAMAANAGPSVEGEGRS